MSVNKPSENKSTIEKVGRFFRYHSIKIERNTKKLIQDNLKSIGESTEEFTLEYWKKINNIVAENINEWKDPQKIINELEKKLPELIEIKNEAKKSLSMVKKVEKMGDEDTFSSHGMELSNTAITDAKNEHNVAVKNVNEVKKKIKKLKKMIEIKVIIKNRINELSNIIPSNDQPNLAI